MNVKNQNDKLEIASISVKIVVANSNDGIVKTFNNLITI